MRLISRSPAESGKVAIVSVSRGIEGGAEIVLRNLLLSYDQPERLILLSPPGSELDTVAQARGIQWLEIPAEADSFLSNLTGFLRVMRGIPRGTVLHAWTRRAFELVSLGALVLRVPCSATLHDQPNAQYISRSRRALMSLSARTIKPLVCVSNHLKSALAGTSLATHATVIPNGVLDFGKYRCRRPRNGVVAIGYAGMQHPQKGLPIVASWIQELIRDGQTVSLSLFGEVHPDLRSVGSQLERLYPGRVRLRGRVPVETIFNEIDILVQASYPVVETFGMVFAEAACAGIPCVSSCHGAEGEVVLDGKTGYLFPALQPEIGFRRLVQLVQSEQLREEIGRNARRHFDRNLRAEVMARRYMALWKSIAEDPG